MGVVILEFFMDSFNYRDDRLFAEDVAIDDIIKEHGSPCYIYSRATLERHWHAFNDAIGEHPHLVCYAVKANSNIGVLSVLAKLGSGFDIVSAGELARVIEAGGDASKVVFSGVGKKHDEIRYALEQGIMCFNVESEPELHRINQVAGEMGVKASISLRINPDRSEEHTSELPSRGLLSYAVFCLKKKNKRRQHITT